MSAERPVDLLLASAPLRRLPDLAKRAPAFERAWQAALKGDDGAQAVPTTEAVKRLLRAAIGICEAVGIDGLDLAALFNARLEAADTATPAELERLVAEASEELLAILAGTKKEIRHD